MFDYSDDDAIDASLKIGRRFEFKGPEKQPVENRFIMDIKAEKKEVKTDGDRQYH